MAAGSALLNARQLLALAGVQSGMRVADFACGHTGHLVLPAAQAVGGEGRVYAIDVLPHHLEMLESRLCHHCTHNAQTMRGDICRYGGVPLEEGSLDRIFFVNNLWQVKDLDHAAAECGRLLAPEGQVFVVDWRHNTTHPVAPRKDLRVPSIAVERAFAKSGGFAKSVPVGPDHFGLLFSFS